MGLECAPILAIGAYTDCVVATGVTEEHVVVVDVVVTVTVPVVDMLSKNETLLLTSNCLFTAILTYELNSSPLPFCANSNSVFSFDNNRLKFPSLSAMYSNSGQASSYSIIDLSKNCSGTSN